MLRWLARLPRTALRKTSIADTAGSPTTPTQVAPVRSVKADGVNVNMTRDKTRDKCIELIYDSLVVGSASRMSFFRIVRPVFFHRSIYCAPVHQLPFPSFFHTRFISVFLSY